MSEEQEPLEHENFNPDLMQFASLFQEWGELCNRRIEREQSSALKWYMAGRRDAHLQDAMRVREFTTQTAKGQPPRSNVLFTTAYEALLNMLDAMTGTLEEQPNLTASHAALKDLVKDNLEENPQERLDMLKGRVDSNFTKVESD